MAASSWTQSSGNNGQATPSSARSRKNTNAGRSPTSFHLGRAVSGPVSPKHLDKLYNHGIEDLQVQADAAIAAGITGGPQSCNEPRSDESSHIRGLRRGHADMARPAFHSLLRQLGDEYDRLACELTGKRSAESASWPILAQRRELERQKSEQASMRARAALRVEVQTPAEEAVLRDAADSRTMLPCLLPGVCMRDEPDDECGPAPVAEPGWIEDIATEKFQLAQESEEERPPELPDSVQLPELRMQKTGTESMDTPYPVHLRWSMSNISGLRRVFKSQHPDVSSFEQSPSDADEAGEANISTYNGKLRMFIALPTSPKRVAWDIAGAVLILYDLVAIPLKVFEPPDTTFTTFVDMFALVFWTLNMFATVTVAYLDDGKFQMNPKRILRNYFKFWLWMDLIVVAPDWAFTLAEMVMGAENSAGSSVKLLRVLRLARCMRLLRLAKLKWIIASIKDLINSESIDILFNIVQMIVYLLAVNHFLACAWFSTTFFDVGPSWASEFDNCSWSYKYATSFHWAITQFTPASMHVQPQNILERTFAIMVVVFGLVGFSYLVGSITGSLTELRRIKEDAVKQFWNLRRFLKKSQVSMPLRIRIEKYVEHAWNLQKDIATSTNLPIMKLLTEQLRNELNCAMSMPHLQVHPLFTYLCSSSVTAMQRIATKALTRRLLARGETNFLAGEIAQHMSFVVAGRLQYFKASADQLPNQHEWVDKGEDWITEPALWTPEWMTLGELVAYSVSELLEVSSQEFAEAIKRTPQVFSRICVYAANFMRWINNKPRNTLSDICQGDEIGEHIEGMLIDSDENNNEDPFLPKREAKRSTVNPAAAVDASVGWMLNKVRRVP